MQGTRAVARGDFATRVPTPTRDEIGFLVHSFNDMTQRLAQASEEARSGQQQVEAERRKLEVILARLSTGVMSLEPDLRIRTANQAAGAILGVDLERHVGESLVELAAARPLLAQFLDVASAASAPQARASGASRSSCASDGIRRVLMCACTELPGDERQPGRLRHRVRRHHDAAAGAARCGLGRSRAAPRARDQEPADADPAFGRAAAPQVSRRASRRGRSICSTARRTRSSSRSRR